MSARDPNPRRANASSEQPPPDTTASATNEEGAHGYLRMVKHTLKEFFDDECPRMAAALSYYTLFSLPPLLVLILMITGVFVDPSAVEGRIETEIDSLMGAGAARQVQEILRAAERPGGSGIGATILSIAALLFGTTGAFMELQRALNRAWEVEPDPKQGGVVRLVTKRLLSLGIAVTVAFLLLVSLLLSAAVSAFGERLGALVPGGMSVALLHVIQLVLSLAVVTTLFALMFKIFPDARSQWRDIWIGALVTALLFVIGKSVLGFYLSRSDPGEAFGAAGSLAVILVWVYYSAMIVFLGAEFTQTWALQRGGGIEPEKGAIRLTNEAPGSKAKLRS